MKNWKIAYKYVITASLFVCIYTNSKAQYDLVWSDEFDGTSLDSTKWNVEDNIGNWNTGDNKELEYYRKQNITVGSDGSGNNCLTITAKKEDYNGYKFTSGRMDTRGKFSFKYGKLVARIKMPDIANGLWPAFWTLGYSQLAWPACGEIDVLEMGYKDGITNTTQNTLMSGALHWQNAGSRADYSKPYIAPSKLNEDYHTYTLVWTPTNIKMYLDSSVTAYFEMNYPSTDGEEFTTIPNFIIFNLAVGGMFPSIYTAAGITAPMPASMLVDYVRVYQKAGEGTLNTQAHPVYGNFGLFDDLGKYNFSLKLNYDAACYSSGTTINSAVTAYEGTSVLAYNVEQDKPFDISIKSLVDRNMNNFKNGSIQFFINTTITDTINIGISDVTGAEAWLAIDDQSKYNFDRTGNWVKVVIPISEFGTTLNFESIRNMLVVKATSSKIASIAIDKAYWTEKVPTNSPFLGIFTDNPHIDNKITIDNNVVHLYIWENTLVAVKNKMPFEGAGLQAFKSTGAQTWFGFGIFSDSPVDLTNYKSGYLHVSINTTASNEFYVGIGGANKTEGKITFKPGSDSYSFARDGKYHEVKIPMADLLKGGLDLSGCGNIFMCGGAGNISLILLDDIYLSANNEDPEAPDAPVGPVGINNINKQNVNIYPIPSAEKITISGLEPNTKFEIYDINGRKVGAYLSSSLSSTCVNIESFASGIYFLKTHSTNSAAVYKLIKK